jgi:ubiquinone/menaquinone biosynthesis C-methylase UbiE
VSEQPTVEQVKERAHATWAAGDFDRVAEKILDVGEDLVRRAGVSAGVELLDVAAGSGNVAIPAARAGAKVVASDLTPELFEAGRRRAAEAGVEIEWVEGDAEDLPFQDGRFDMVLSTFGTMFAPRHQVAADETVRVTKPGGLIGMCNWTPEGYAGQFFKTIAAHMPPPPDLAQPPVLWGTEQHVQKLYEPHGIRLEFHRRQSVQEYESIDAYIDFFTTYFGPTIGAKEITEADGRWEDLRRDWTELARQWNKADDGGFRVEAEYLIVLGRKPG